MRARSRFGAGVDIPGPEEALVQGEDCPGIVADPWGRRHYWRAQWRALRID